MAETTAISWVGPNGKTWSPWIGCTKVSPACDGCYAEHLMDTRMGRVTWGPHGERSRTSAGYWRKPLSWNREAQAAGVTVSVFPSLCDPFDNRADPAVRREWFDLIRATPNLLWLLLTKRPQNIVAMAEAAGGLPDNTALGTTCEDRRRVEVNLTALRAAEYALRPRGRTTFTFASFEPLLGDVGDLTPWLYHEVPLGWAITGGETGQGAHKARPSHPNWYRSIRDQCAAAGVPYHHKQNGEWVGEARGRDWMILSADGDLDIPDDRWPDEQAGEAAVTRVGKKAAGRLLDGVEHNGFPEARP